MYDNIVSIEEYKIRCMLDRLEDLMLDCTIDYDTVESILLNLVDEYEDNKNNEIIFSFLIESKLLL